MKHFLLFTLLCMLAFTAVNATPIDTTWNQTEQVTQADKDIPDEGIPFEGAAMFVLLVLVVGIGIVLSIIILSIFFALVAAGIISASVVHGLNKKSFTAGIKIFLLLSGGAGGLFLAVAGMFLASTLFHVNLHTTTAIIIGGGCGLLGGLLIGGLCYYLFQLMLLRVKQKFGVF